MGMASMVNTNTDDLRPIHLLDWEIYILIIR